MSWLSNNKLSEYTILHNLGSGVSGYVKAALRSDGIPVAIKYIFKRKLIPGDIVRNRNLGIIPREVSILNRIMHDNIIRLLDYFEDSHFYYIVMESPAVCCDLFDIIERCMAIDEKRIQKIFKQIVSAVSYLHSNNIVHRDIKDENVIVDSNDKVYLIDFGAATEKPQTKSEYFTDVRGTLMAVSPEVIRGERHCGVEQDAWALGILLFTMSFNRIPYNEDIIVKKWRKRELLSELNENDFQLIQQDKSNLLQNNRSCELINLIRSLLDPDMEKRIKVQDILNHEWFTKLDLNTSE
jgi:protein-serine/threonine kinase